MAAIVGRPRSDKDPKIVPLLIELKETIDRVNEGPFRSHRPFIHAARDAMEVGVNSQGSGDRMAELIGARAGDRSFIRLPGNRISDEKSLRTHAQPSSLTARCGSGTAV